LENTIDKKDATILRLSDVNVKDEPVVEKPVKTDEKPVKKVRRKSSKKNIKKEE
jgi:formylmethanofuran dehydrogenase subunit B